MPNIENDPAYRKAMSTVDDKIKDATKLFERGIDDLRRKVAALQKRIEDLEGIQKS